MNGGRMAIEGSDPAILNRFSLMMTSLQLRQTFGQWRIIDMMGLSITQLPKERQLMTKLHDQLKQSMYKS